MEESRQLDIDQYQIKTLNEKLVSTSCMDFYYSNLESLKTRLNQMQDKFEVDHEESENRIAYKRARNEKLRDQRKFLGEEILRFHTEIEQMHEREEQEAAVRERRKRVNEFISF